MVPAHKICKLLDIAGLIGLPTAFYLYTRLHPQPVDYFDWRHPDSCFTKPAQVTGVWLAGSLITHLLCIGEPWISRGRWIYTIFIPVAIILVLLEPVLLLLVGHSIPELVLFLGAIYVLMSLGELYKMGHPPGSGSPGSQASTGPER